MFVWVILPIFSQNNEGEKGGKGSFERGAVRGSRCSCTPKHRQEGGKFMRKLLFKNISVNLTVVRF